MDQGPHTAAVSSSRDTDKKEVVPTDKKEVAPADQSVPFLKLFSFAKPLDVVLMLIGTIGGVVNGVSMPLIALLFGQLIDAFGKNANTTDTYDDVLRVSLRFIYVGIGALLASFAQVTCWMVAGERQAARIRGLYLKAILRQDVTFFDKEAATGEVVGRMSGDTILIQEAVGEKVGKVLQLVSTFIGGFVVAFIKGWKLTLMMLVTIPPLVFVGAVLMLIISKATSRGQTAYAQAGDVAEQAIGAIRTVAAFVGEKKSIEAYGKKLKVAYKATIYQGMATGFGLGAFMLIMFSSYSLAFWYGSKLILNSGYSGGTVVNVVFAVLMGGMSLGQASPSLNAFGAGKAAAYKMFEVIHRVPDIDSYNLNGQVLKDLRGEIEFRNVDFSYPARPDVKIFSNFSIHIPEGLTVALVGESGSGKSTVISLIERFYDPQGGSVLLDGVDIKQLQLKWFRQQTGLVSQEPILFGTSIMDNIAYGKDGATLEEVQQAALLANAASFISRLPQGYNTLVGEHGTQLSGGQKQRIAIARAILKNPRILLLDEATSALDAESERLVQEAVDRVMMGRTTIVVAHRLTTVRNADLIAVVQHGVIVELGKHDELLQNSTGAYSQLIRLQQIHRQEDSKEDVDEVETTNQRSERRSGSNKFFRRSSSLNSDSDRSFRSASLRLSRKEAVTPAKKGKGFLCWCKHKVAEGDLEAGDGKPAVPDVSIFRLAGLNKPEIPIYILGSLFAIVNGCIFPVYGLLMSKIIKTFFEPRDQLRKDANFWASMFLVIACVAFTVMPIQIISFSIGGNKLIQRVRRITFERVLRQEISWFDESENSSGAISARLSGDAAQVRSIVGDTLSLAVQNCATIVASLAIGFSANWLLTLVVLAIVPLLGLQGLAHVKFMKGFSADAKVMYEDASQVANDAVGSIRTVSSFCAEDKVLNLYHDKCRFPLQKGVRQGILSGFAFGFANFVMFAAYAFCFWFGAKMVQNGKTSFGDVFKVFFAISMGAISVSQSAGLLPDVSNAKAAVNSMFALLDRQSKIDSTDSAGLIPDSVDGNIAFRHVSFRYPSRPDVKVLRDLSLVVKSGRTVALVGESGCGKSTVIALLERFYDPDSGHIFLDGNDIKNLQVRWLRQQIGLVGRPHEKDEEDKDWAGREKDGSARYRRSGLGGYSPRRRRSDAAIRTPSPPARSPERRKTRAWDLPPVGMDSGVAAAMAAAHQAAAQQAAALASVSSLVTVNPALAAVSLTQATRNFRRLYIGNVPASVSDGELLEFINAAMMSVHAYHLPGTKPCINCMVNVEKSYAFAEFLTPEDATAGLAFDGITLHGTTLKIRRPRDYIPPPNGGIGITSVLGMVSSAVPDSPQKIFVGGICKTLSAEKVKEIVTAFGQLKAYHWEVTVKNHQMEAFAFLEYLDPSVTLKACAGLNGMRLGNKILTVVQATPNASSEPDEQQAPFYGIPEHAKTLLEAPTRILEFQNVISRAEALSLSEAELSDIEQDVRIECMRFGTVKSSHVVKPEGRPDQSALEASLGDGGSTDKLMLQDKEAYMTDVDKKIAEYIASVGGQYLQDGGDLAEGALGASQMDATAITSQASGASNVSIGEAKEVPPLPSEGDGASLGVEPPSSSGEPAEDKDINKELKNSSEQPISEEMKETSEPGLGEKAMDLDEKAMPMAEQHSSDTSKPIGKSAGSVALLTDSDMLEAAADAVESLNSQISDSDLGRVYVEFTREECACKAAHTLHGRLYGDRTVTVAYFPLKLYQKRFKKGLEPRTHEERQILALAAQEHLNSFIPDRD